MVPHTQKQKVYIQSLYGGYRMCISTHLINTYLNYCYTHCHYNLSKQEMKGVYELHHLFPRGLTKYLNGKHIRLHRNGTNKVWLTPKEHIQAHKLLNSALKKCYRQELNYKKKYTKKT